MVVASTGLLALVPWGARGLYKASAIEHKACPPAMGGESYRTITYPAVVELNGLRAPATVVGEVLRCQHARNYIGKEVDVR